MNNDRSQFSFGARMLLQVDLEGHSSWVTTAASKPAVAKARMQFAEKLHSSLINQNFRLLSWKGDGGVYEAGTEGQSNFDFAITAAHSAASDFNTWRNESTDRVNLRLRISLHHASYLYIHSEPGYWASDDLNVFLKYERDIGVSGTIAITQAVFPHLSENLQSTFTESRRRSLSVPGKPALITQIHYAPLPDETALNRSSTTGFFEWVHSRKFDGALRCDSSVGPDHLFRLTIGDATFLFATPSSGSPFSIDLVQVEPPNNLSLTKEEQIIWDQMTTELREAALKKGYEDGRKVSPVRLVLPLSDIPFARIEYYVETWSRARSFHSFIEKNSYLRNRLANNVLDVQESGFACPGIGCCHMIIRTADPGACTALLCQRQRKGQDGNYHSDRWSLSIEEQLRPTESIEECVSRGLAEELLGEQGISGVTSQVVGAIIEKSILNLSFIVLVDVPLTLDEISEYWSSAIDRDEHRQLATIALDDNTVRQLLSNGSLDEEIRGMIQPAHPSVFHSNDKWELHPTSIARAVMYVWIQNNLKGQA